MHFDLKAPALPGPHPGPVPEAAVLEKPAERNDVRRERAAEVGRMASSMKTPEIAIQLPFGGPDTTLVANDQGRIHRDYRVSGSGFSANPVEDFVGRLQARNIPKP
jgi:hypothetical protein